MQIKYQFAFEACNDIKKLILQRLEFVVKFFGIRIIFLKMLIKRD